MHYYYYLPLFFCHIFAHEDTVSIVNIEKYTVAKHRRYFLYDVNHGEGFNLRRDVYMRLANTVRLLRESGENFVLVLPPWGGLYHWGRDETKIRWDTFFDVNSLDQFVPVIEFDDYVKESQSLLIENVIYLQHYKEGWGKEYVMKYDRRDCIDGHKYYKKENDSWLGWFYSFSNMRAKQFECVSIQGDSAVLRDLILKEYPNQKSLFFDRGETILHQHYGDEFYWQARRSMRYSKDLIEIADRFREKALFSSDILDNTVLPSSWRDEVKRGPTRGGEFVCVHWRRRDFIRAHGKELPSIQGTARQLNAITKKNGIPRIFIATDAPDEDVDYLQSHLHYPLVRFRNTSMSDGAVAIVDQWVCAHARFFVGSYVSTFSFRIQEDREILGFAPETTFNRLCPDDNNSCEQPAKWTIVY